MKNPVIILVLFFGLFACGGSDKVQIGEKTTMEVNEVFDAGDVIKGEQVKAIFTIKNTGSHPLVIADVSGSCSCTVASKPEEPINPGESAEIEASVNTNNTGTGTVVKDVKIVANTTPSTTNLYIKANVISK